MPRKAMRDVVVCLPGITGSVLQKDGRDVWNISGGARHQRADARSVSSIGDLKLEDDPPDVDDLGDGITAPEVIRDIHLIPGLWKIDGYTKHAALHRGDVRRHAGRELLRVPVRLATRQPRRRAPAPAREREVAAGLAAVERRRRREAGARRPLDGRPGLALLPRVPRRLARHAHARHVRDAVPRLAERARHARERQEDHVLRPHASWRARSPRSTSCCRPIPATTTAAATSPGSTRRTSRTSTGREDQGGARLPPRDRSRGRGEPRGSCLRDDRYDLAPHRRASSSRRTSRRCATATASRS